MRRSAFLVNSFLVPSLAARPLKISQLLDFVNQFSGEANYSKALAGLQELFKRAFQGPRDN